MMGSSQSAHKTIVKNTFALYLRMFITMGVSIYTTRVVLQTLGVVDYGIYNIVGGLIAIITTVSGSLTISVQRFLNYAQGKGQDKNLTKVFSSAIIIHIIIALVVFAVLESFGIYYLNSSINIPPERHHAAVIVYHLCTLSACITLAASPFTSLIVSFERMDIFAYFSIIDVVLKLIIVYCLLLVPDGRLVLYGLLTFATTCVITFANWLVCRIKFSKVKIVPRLDKQLFKEIFSFASWSALGQMAWAFTSQGANILLNIFFGTVLNAAYGVTMQVQAAVSRFVQSFQTALNPQIIKSYAKNDIDEFITLIVNGSKYSGFLLLLIIIPLFIEIDNILNIWLTEVPDYTAVFCRFALINILWDTMSNLLATGFQAYGKIRKYQLTVSIILFLNFPLSYIALRFFSLPYYIYIIYGVVSISLLLVRLYLMSVQMKIRLYRAYFTKVLWPIFKVVTIVGVASYFIYLWLDEMSGITQLLAVVGVCITITLISEFLFGINNNERANIVRSIKARINS